MAQVAGSPVAPMAAMTGVTERGCSTTRLRFASASGQPPTATATATATATGTGTA